jgi:hypothetical protein
MNNSVQQTAHAFFTVYRALPEDVQQEVRHLIIAQETERAAPDENAQAKRVQQMERIIAPLRVPLPIDYKFDRDEANER